MSSTIETKLASLRDAADDVHEAILAIAVRDTIAGGLDDAADAIEECYSNVSNPTLQTEALEAAVQAKIDEGEMAALTIGDGTITTAKIADGAITQAKLAEDISFEADSALSTTSTNALQNKVITENFNAVNTSLENIFNAEKSGTSYAWELGSFQPSDGSELTSTIRIRTVDYIKLEQGDSIHFSGDFTGMVIYAYDLQYNFSSANSVTGWTKSGYTALEDMYVRIAVRKAANDPTINEDDFATLEGYISIHITAIRNMIDSLADNIFDESKSGTTYTWEYGSLMSTDGTEIAATNRIRTGFLSFQGGEKIRFTGNYVGMVIYAYDNGYNFSLANSVVTWTGDDYTVPANMYIKLAVRKNESNSEITTEDFSTLEGYISIERERTFDEAVDEKVDAAVEEAMSEIPPNDLTEFYRFNKQIWLYNPYANKGNMLLKGQMHCHTTNSDGLYSAATLAQMYVDADYDFMTITDHNGITGNPSNNAMLWLCDSYEDTNSNQHCNVYNTDETYGRISMYDTSNTLQSLIEHYVTNGDSVLCINHPEFYGASISNERLEALTAGFSFVEVWNGSIASTSGTVATVADLPSSNVRWNEVYYVSGEDKYYISKVKNSLTPSWEVCDRSAIPEGNLDRAFRILLDKGFKVFCISTDDCHGISSFNYGWVTVFAKNNSVPAIWEALLSGAFYASSGVVYTDVSCEEGVLSVTIDPVEGETYTTTFYGTGNAVLATVTGTTASYEITGSEAYVRAMTASSKDNQTKAWTQPVWVKSTKKQYEF